jgi:hypothetical protein
LVRNLRSGGAALHFASSAIRQSDLNSFSAHAWRFSPVETTSLLARANAVKAAGGCFMTALLGCNDHKIGYTRVHAAYGYRAI